MPGDGVCQIDVDWTAWSGVARGYCRAS
jgi:hypothetical protein